MVRWAAKTASIAARSGARVVVGGESNTKVRRRTAAVAMTQSMISVLQGSLLFVAAGRFSEGMRHLVSTRRRYVSISRVGSLP